MSSLLPQASPGPGSGLGRRQEGGRRLGPHARTQAGMCGVGLATSPAHALGQGSARTTSPDSTQEGGCSWAVKPRKSQCVMRTEDSATCQDLGSDSSGLNLHEVSLRLTSGHQRKAPAPPWRPGRPAAVSGGRPVPSWRRPGCCRRLGMRGGVPGGAAPEQPPRG